MKQSLALKVYPDDFSYPAACRWLGRELTVRREYPSYYSYTSDASATEGYASAVPAMSDASIYLDYKHNNTHGRWLGCELMARRGHATGARLALAGRRNAALLVGDAALALERWLPPACLDAVYVNHPEPPQQSSAGSGGSEAGRNSVTPNCITFLIAHIPEVTGNTTEVMGPRRCASGASCSIEPHPLSKKKNTVNDTQTQTTTSEPQNS